MNASTYSSRSDAQAQSMKRLVDKQTDLKLDAKGNGYLTWIVCDWSSSPFSPPDVTTNPLLFVSISAMESQEELNSVVVIRIFN